MPQAFAIRAMTAADAAQIAAWRYDGEYAFYDADADPDDLAELLDPREWGTRYFAVDLEGELAGFHVYKQEGDTVELGLGLRPDLTSRGLGLAFVGAAIDHARTHHDATHLALAVAAFNRRAITVYERAGFRATARYEHVTNGGVHPFIRMERD